MPGQIPTTKGKSGRAGAGVRAERQPRMTSGIAMECAVAACALHSQNFNPVCDSETMAGKSNYHVSHVAVALGGSRYPFRKFYLNKKEFGNSRRKDKGQRPVEGAH